MRFARAPAGGAAPSTNHLRSLLTSCKRGTIEWQGDQRAECDTNTVATLVERVDVVPPRKSFDHLYPRWAQLVLHATAPQPTIVDFTNDGTVRVRGWNSFAELRGPREALQWFADHGVDELVRGWDNGYGEGADVRRQQWRAHLPKALKWPWRKRFERLADHAFDADALRRRLVQKVGAPEAIGSLLHWYGALSGELDDRPGYEEIPRRILTGFGFDPIVKHMATVSGQQALAGAARFLLGAMPLSDKLANVVRTTLPSASRASIVDAAGAQLGSSAAQRVAGAWEERTAEVAEGWEIVGRSQSSELHHVVSDGSVVFALDGTEVVRLEGGTRSVITWQLDRTAPLHVFEGDVVIQRNGKAVRIRRTGEEEVLGPAEAFRVPSSSQSIASLSNYKVVAEDGRTLVLGRT